MGLFATSSREAPAGGEGLGSRTNLGREAASTWVARLLAAERLWLEDDLDREQLRAMLSENEFPFLMVRDLGPGVGASVLQKLNPQVDQIDLNLGLRYAQKLKSNAGDESPEVKHSRDWTEGWRQLADPWDRFIQRVLARAGAPENNAEGTGDTCTDGVTTYWMGLSYGLTGADLEQLTEDIDEAIERVLSDPEGYTPVEGQDHAFLADQFEERAFDSGAVMNDPTGAISEALMTGAYKHRTAAAKELKTGKVDWRFDRLQITHERLPYGTHALKDPTAITFRQARWVARRCRMPVEEARRHPAYHPALRRKICAVEFDGSLNEAVQLSRSARTPTVDQAELGGLADIWEIHDRKFREIIYLDIHAGVILNAGYVTDKDGNQVSRMRHPFIDEKDQPLIKAIGGHPGFFPCDFLTPQPPKRDTVKKIHGLPLLAPGKKILFAISKMKSSFVNSLKRASTAVYEAHPKLGESGRRAVKLNIDGSVFSRPADVPPGESVKAIEWKPPSEQLFRQVNDLVSDWCMVQSFPLGELTTRPVADTVGQEEIGLMSGDVWMLEVLRKFEISYGIQAYMAGVLAMEFLPMTDWVELIGPEEGAALYELLVTKKMGLPPDLPAVRFASRRRDQHPVRVKQILDFDERIATKLDPMLGIQKYEDETWLQECARSLNLGRLERYEPNKEHLQMIATAKGQALAEAQLAGAGGPGAPGGGAPPGPGGEQAPMEPPTAEGIEGLAMGANGESGPTGGQKSPGGSAAQKRPSKRRGGRRGRATGAPTASNQGSEARAVGPR